MRTISLKELKDKTNRNTHIINSINDLVESTPRYSPIRKRPRNEVELKILKKFESR